MEAVSADGVLRVLVVDPDAAWHAHCHMALRGLRLGRRPVQLLHARTAEDAADLLALHGHVPVAVVPAGTVVPAHGAGSDRVWTVVRVPGTGPGGNAHRTGVDAVIAGPDPAGRLLFAAVVAGLRAVPDPRLSHLAENGFCDVV
jgi:hypothetical protein